MSQQVVNPNWVHPPVHIRFSPIDRKTWKMVESVTVHTKEELVGYLTRIMNRMKVNGLRHYKMFLDDLEYEVPETRPKWNAVSLANEIWKMIDLHVSFNRE